MKGTRTRWHLLRIPRPHFPYSPDGDPHIAILVWTTGDFPCSFLTATIITLLKPNKDPASPKSFRAKSSNQWPLTASWITSNVTMCPIWILKKSQHRCPRSPHPRLHHPKPHHRTVATASPIPNYSKSFGTLPCPQTLTKFYISAAETFCLHSDLWSPTGNLLWSRALHPVHLYTLYRVPAPCDLLHPPS